VAFKLSKQETADREGHVERLEKVWGELTEAVNAYNTGVAKLREPVDKAVADYNEALGEAKAFAEQVASRLEGEYDDKSEKWQEGEAGEAAAEFRDAWQSVDLEDLANEWPEDLAIEDPDHAPELSELPTEA
jgi:hypothetical protein